MKYRSFTFAALGSLLIIAFFFVTNYLTSWGHPWFIYPTFLVVWWPMSMLFAANKKFKLFSIIGTIWISLFFIAVNLITSPGYLWCIYPIFAALWWPLSMYVAGAKKYKLYSVLASIMTIAFFAAVNYISSPNTLWFFYPAFAIIWWPLSLLICGAKKYKLYSVIMSLVIIAFFGLLNLLYSADYLWFYYPTFLVLWWPLSMFFAKKKFIKLYSVIMSLSMVAFLALTNYFNTPNIWWFQYTIFYFLWWPIVMLLGKKAKTLAFSIISAAIIIAYHVWLNLYLMPGVFPWFWYMVLPVLWWPVCIALKDRAKSGKFFLVSLAIFFAYYIVLNIILSPTYIWIPYLTYPALWLAMGLYFYKKNKLLLFSITATVITAAFFITINVIHTPNHIWAVYPIFIILWWPLSVYFYKVREKKRQVES
ncbi:MAG: hypothetical protein KAQ68_07085 [Clostridiales bacterium]|nr:hypothetical protein [Clostridiales bacterium]